MTCSLNKEGRERRRKYNRSVQRLNQSKNIQVRGEIGKITNDYRSISSNAMKKKN